MRRKIAAEQVCAELGVPKSFYIEIVEREWIRPIDRDREELDDEDVARLRLIHELIEDFGVNPEGVPIILHLIDQLHAMRRLIRNAA